MLTGAFFGIFGADKTGSWVARAARRRSLAGGALALVHAFFAIHLRADQIVERDRDQLPGARHHRVSLHRHLRRRRARRPTSPSIPNVHLGISRRRAVRRRHLRPAQPDDLDRLPPHRRSRGSSCSGRRRSADPRRGRAPARGRHGRHHGLPIRYVAVVVSGMLAAPRRRVPLDRVRQLVQREHDRRARVHRARRAHLRQMEAVRAAAATLLFGFSSALASGCPSTRSLPRCSSRRSRTCSH